MKYQLEDSHYLLIYFYAKVWRIIDTLASILEQIYAGIFSENDVRFSERIMSADNINVYFPPNGSSCWYITADYT